MSVILLGTPSPYLLGKVGVGVVVVMVVVWKSYTVLHLPGEVEVLSHHSGARGQRTLGSCHLTGGVVALG